MKKFIYAALVCLCMSLTGCDKFESKETPLNDDGLVSFTELNEKNDTLIGVKNIKTGQVVLAPAKVDSVDADQYVIYTKTGDKVKIYRQNGKQIGKTGFSDVWLKFTFKDNFPIFICSAESEQTFYFPLSGEEVTGTKYFLGLKHFFVQETEQLWSLYTTSGKRTWRILVENGFYLIKDLAAKEETFYIGLKEKNTVALYDVKGKKFKTVPLKSWNKAKRLMRRTAQIGSADYMECKNAAKL